MQQQVDQEVPKIELEDYKDFKYRAKNFYHIRTEDNKLKKFDFTQPQEYFHQIVQEEFDRTEKQFGTKKCNVIILKPRRMGATTFFSIFGIDQMIMNDMYQGLMIAHDTDTSDAVYDMYKRCYDYLPDYFIPTEDGEQIRNEEGEEVHIKLKPDPKSYSGKRLSFEDNDSLLTIRTAGAGDAVGKSIGLNFFHGCLSEDSFVILSDGTSKPIKDIQEGDKVITHNGNVAPVKENFYTGTKQTYRISVENTNKTISVTEDHKILTEKGWQQLKDINEGQYIVQASHPCVDAISDKILSITEDRKVDVYDLEIDHEDHSYQTPVGIVSNSEAGNWPEFNETLTSLNQALDMGAETLCVIESTANGVSGIGEGFYNLWQQSKKAWEKFKAGKTSTFEGFRPIFIPWYLIDKYRRPLAGGKLIDVEDAFPSEEQKKEFIEQEQRLLDGVRNPVTGEMVYVDKEQLNWRRWYFKEKCNYDYNKLKRYYPTTDEEAFTASNVCYFDSQKLSEVKTYYLHEKQNDYKIGDIIWDDNSEVSFKKNPLGSFKIWEEPEDKWEYRYLASCLPEGEKVVTDSGLKEIQEVDQDDKLINEEGNEVDIVDFKKNWYEDKLISIRPSNTVNPTRFTKEHPILVSKDSKLKRFNRMWGGERFWEHNFEFRDAEEVEEGDWIKYPNIYTQELSEFDIKEKWEKYINKRYDFRKDDPLLDEEFWWYVGIWLAEGWVSVDKTGYRKRIYTVHNYEKEREYADKINNLFSKYDCSVDISRKESTKSVWTVSFSHNELATFLVNEFGSGAENKGIPEWVKYLPHDYKVELLKGYLNGDGCFTEYKGSGNDSTEFVSVSLELLEGIQDILFSLGIVSSINVLREAGVHKFPNGRKCNTLKTYHLRFNVCDTIYFKELLGVDHEPYSTDRRKGDCYISNDNKYIYFQVKDVEREDYEGYVYNFECNTHTYLAKHLTTHNCDPAYGYEDGDYAVIKVFDRLKQKFVARWHGKVDEDILAEIATKIGLYYNEALLIPERNLKTVVNILKPDGIHPYVGEIYWEESGRDLKYGKFMGNDRKVILDMYRAWLREDYYKLPDAAEVHEHLSFVKKETKRGSVDTVKYEADDNSHDDIVICNALAIYADSWMDKSPKERSFKKLTDMIKKPKRKQRKSWKQSGLGKKRSHTI